MPPRFKAYLEADRAEEAQRLLSARRPGASGVPWSRGSPRRYVSLHDAGRILNPALFDGQVRGGFAMAVGAALYERLVYAGDGGFITGSLLDYALPTASMVPELEILHQETPSPVTPLGAKGVAEGNSMSTPACIANAVADALGVAEVNLPLTPERVLEMVRRRGQ